MNERGVSEAFTIHDLVKKWRLEIQYKYCDPLVKLETTH